jgi:hypothetical protein
VIPDFGAQQKNASELQEFAKSLFQLWDKQGFGKLKIIELAKNFIALGLASTEEIAISFFKNIVK